MAHTPHQRIAVLHPGAMGAAIAQALHDNGHPVAWCAQGRSNDTANRARPFQRFETLPELTAWATTIFSVVPPHAAIDTARQVAGTAFTGTYVDANAIAPTTAAEVQAIIQAAGATCIDASIIGPPPKERAASRLYLADTTLGQHAQPIADLFKDSGFEAPILTDMGPQAASALKMVYAAWTKGSAAMLLATARTAEALGVMQALHDEWSHSVPDLPPRLERTTRAAGPKAWRYVGEMLEIASTFHAAGQPAEFHKAAAEVYDQVARQRSEVPATTPEHESTTK